MCWHDIGCLLGFCSRLIWWVQLADERRLCELSALIGRSIYCSQRTRGGGRERMMEGKKEDKGEEVKRVREIIFSVFCICVLGCMSAHIHTHIHTVHVCICECVCVQRDIDCVLTRWEKWFIAAGLGGNNVFIRGGQRSRPHCANITPYRLDRLHTGQSTHLTLHHCSLQTHTHSQSPKST